MPARAERDGRAAIAAVVRLETQLAADEPDALDPAREQQTARARSSSVVRSR